jgi:hypothetical protein
MLTIIVGGCKNALFSLATLARRASEGHKVNYSTGLRDAEVSLACALNVTHILVTPPSELVSVER